MKYKLEEKDKFLANRGKFRNIWDFIFDFIYNAKYFMCESVPQVFGLKIAISTLLLCI